MKEDFVAGAIFAGGESSRFGSPKINALIDSEEFGFRIARSMRESGIDQILLVGGSEVDAVRWSLTFVADEVFGAGPFAALLAAIHNSDAPILLTMPCDVPWIDIESCKRLSAIDEEFDVQVAVTDSPQWLSSSWRRSALQHLEQQFASGERAIHRAVIGLKVNYLQLPPDALRNVNTPNDLI
ncbi:MAG: molybdenum cofactor guanylyltransferase [Actinobacteria bacterium]|nr:molybdenum cofactor guanylyltransferase [Actinomycetota bacterium]